MLTPAEADAVIAAALAPVSQEMAPLPACAGRILQAALRAERDAPPFNRVAMDGIAFRHENESRRRVSRRPAFRLRAVRHLTRSADDCFEVMTGAILPAGCDTVVPVEDLRMAEGHAELLAGVQPSRGRHVHRRGSDAQAGEILLEAGVRLAAPEVAVAASTGHAALPVSRVPRIAVISTGDELVEPGAPILDHQVRRSNAYGLAAALTLAGFPPVTDLQLPDREDVIRTALDAALEQRDRARALRRRLGGALRSRAGCPGVARR